MNDNLNATFGAPMSQEQWDEYRRNHPNVQLYDPSKKKTESHNKDPRDRYKELMKHKEHLRDKKTHIGIKDDTLGN